MVRDRGNRENQQLFVLADLLPTMDVVANDPFNSTPIRS
jgi:hypothetical protein